MASNLPLRRASLGLGRLRVQVHVTQPAKRFQSTASTATQSYPLYPSVAQLLHEKGIPESEVSKIPATGPKGRLLKGDVLAYLGEIPADYPATLSAQLAKKAHLDLSNIKLATPPPPPEPAPAPESAPATVEEPEPETSVAVAISLDAVLAVQKRLKKSLGVTVPLTTFIERATDVANDDLPRSPLDKLSADELFDEIIGAGSPARTSRGSYIPEINTVSLSEAEALESQSEPEPAADIIDVLAGNVRPSTTTTRTVSVAAEEAEGPADTALNVFSLRVPEAEKRRASIFLERLRTLLTVEPGRLVL